MKELTPWFDSLAHIILILGVIVFAFPLYYTLVGSTHTLVDILSAPMPLAPGKETLDNYKEVLFVTEKFTPSAVLMLWNSLIMAIVITVGKIVLSLLSAFAIVYFNFPFRMFFFGLIFVTLMLPVEVRILPTFEVVANFGMLNSFAGLTIPLLASATGTFLFRQFFLTIPDELIEASKIDGASPMQFFFSILLPLSRTNTAALFVIMFIYGWNQYMWPLLITTDYEMTTIVMGIGRTIQAVDGLTYWNEVMSMAILSLLPPVLVVVFMFRWFVKGLIDIEK